MAMDNSPGSSTNSQRELLCLGFADHERHSVSELLKECGWPVRFFRSPAKLFDHLDGGGQAGLFLLRLNDEYDASNVTRILRFNEISAPIHYFCESGLEAGYYAAQSGHLGLRYGHLLPFESDEAALVQLVYRSEELSLGALVNTGEVDEVGLAGLMVKLAANRYSGLLRLDRAGSLRAVHFWHGSPVYAESNLLTEIFGPFLVSRGVISEIEYRWAQKLQEREGIRQGEALVKIGVLTNKSLFNHLREQIRTKIVNGFVPGPTQYVLEPFPEGGEPRTQFAFDLLELLIAGLLRTVPEDELEAMWKGLSGSFLLALPGRQALLSKARAVVGGRVFEAAAENKTIGELFEETTPIRQRVATIRALEATAIAIVCETTPSRVYASGAEDDDEELRFADVNESESEGKDEIVDRVIGKYLEAEFDHFAVLEITRDADSAAVRRAYEALREQFSTEKIGDITEIRSKLDRIRERIDQAFSVLSDAEQRRAYEDSLMGHKKRRRTRRTIAFEAEEVYRKGLGMLTEERFKDAYECFSQATKMNTTEPLYLLHEGWSRVRAAGGAQSEDYSAGKQLITRALGVNPLMTEGYVMLARTCIIEGDTAEALENAHMALQLDANNADAKQLVEELTHPSEVG